QLLLDPSSIVRKNNNGFNIIFLNFKDWIHYKNSNTNSEFDNLIQRNANDLLDALHEASNSSLATYFIFICPYSPEILLDKPKNNFLNQIETKLLTTINKMKGVYLVTSEELAKKYPIKNYYDSYT